MSTRQAQDPRQDDAVIEAVRRAARAGRRVEAQNIYLANPDLKGPIARAWEDVRLEIRKGI